MRARLGSVGTDMAGRSGDVQASLFVEGTPGNDTLVGTSGDDEIYAGTGSDQITALQGNDSVILDHPDTGDFADGGEGSDFLYLDASNAAATVVLSGGQVFLGGTLIATGFEGFWILAGSGNDTLIGGSKGGLFYSGAGDDTIDLSKGDGDVLWEAYSEGGNDRLTGSAGGAEFLYGGDGDDVVDVGAGGGWGEGNAGNDSLIGGSGFEYLYGGEGDDRLETASAGGQAFGEAGNDNLMGGEGDDWLDGGTGVDRIAGGAGKDGILLRDADEGDFADGGEGNGDNLDFNASNATVEVVVSGGQVFVGDYLIATGFENFWIQGGSANDILVGGSESSTLVGNGGDDLLDHSASSGEAQAYGGTGHDTLIGGGDDYLEGGDGNDLLQTGDVGGEAKGGAGDDALTGGAGIETLFGGDGQDVLETGEGGGLARGGAGNDVLMGGTGADRLGGGKGDDLLTGGAGADQFQFVAFNGAGRDTIADFEVGLDVLVLRNVTIASLVEDDLDGADGLDTLVTLSNGTSVALLGVSGIMADDLT